MTGIPPLGLLAAVFAVACLPVPAFAHPHVFVDARMEVEGDGKGHLTGLKNIWAMDELFSASVIPDFDANANGRLDPDELAAVGEQVRKSIAEWGFYTFARIGPQELALVPPEKFDVRWDDKTGKLIFRFTMVLDHPADLTAAPVTLSNFDKTYFVAFDFPDIGRFALNGFPKACRERMVTPTPGEAEKIWMATLAQLGPDDSVPPPEDGINFSEALATRLELDCRQTHRWRSASPPGAGRAAERRSRLAPSSGGDVSWAMVRAERCGQEMPSSAGNCSHRATKPPQYPGSWRQQPAVMREDRQGPENGGRDRDRTCDPFGVNEVLSR